MANKNLYNKGKELLAQAEQISDPDVKQAAINAAKRYFSNDIRGGDKKLQILNLVAMLVSWILILGVIATVFFCLSINRALCVMGFSVILIPLLFAIYLRAIGKIKETTLWGMYKAGIKGMLDFSSLVKPNG